MSTEPDRRRPGRIAISRLASYAADPVEHCRLRGRARSAAAARAGEAFHQRAIVFRPPWWVLIALAAGVLAWIS